MACVAATTTAKAQMAEPIRGMIGVGTWGTQAEFKDIKVTKGDKTLFASDFSKGLQGWKTEGGKWTVVNGALRQSSGETGPMALIGDPKWSDYTLTLKARKLGGEEGFLIAFGLPNANVKSQWNVGGWNNTGHGFESPGILSTRVPGKVETNRWYDIKIVLNGTTVQAYLDNKMIESVTKIAPTPLQRDFGHPLVPDLIADPSIAEFDGTFYLYGTTDIGAGLAMAGRPVVWKSKDFLHWSFVGSIFDANFDAKYWAPSAPIQKDGRYYLFPTLDERITAVVSDSPEGPFRTLDGKDITKNSGWKPFPITTGKPIDTAVFRDDDGSYYMVWSMHGMGKLKPDFSGFEGEPISIPTKRKGYSEGPDFFKRNGIYYYLYTLDGHETYKYAYMMSRTSPLGPWEAPEQDIVASTDHEKGIYGPGHGCFFRPKGFDQWIFAYLEYGRSGATRQVRADKLNFNADGTIRPVELTLEGLGALRADLNYARPNLALGKNATASSVLPDFKVPPIFDPRINRIEGYAPNNALDGSNGSRWMPRADDKNAWYQLDLGQVQEIQRTELSFVTPTAGHAYRLEYSLDGKSWQRYGGHAALIVQSPHTDLNNVRARYLKVTVLQGAPGLWEFRVY